MVTNPLQFPLQGDFSQVDGEPAVLQRRGAAEPEPLHRWHHVADQRVPHREVRLQIQTKINHTNVKDEWVSEYVCSFSFFSIKAEHKKAVPSRY